MLRNLLTVPGCRSYAGIKNEQLVALRPTGVQDADWGKARDASAKLYSDDTNGLINNRDALKAEIRKTSGEVHFTRDAIQGKRCGVDGRGGKSGGKSGGGIKG